MAALRLRMPNEGFGTWHEGRISMELLCSRTVIGTSGAQAVGTAFDGNDCWSCFSLSNMPISDAGMRGLALAIVGRHWHTIVLGFTNITNVDLKSCHVPLCSANQYFATLAVVPCAGVIRLAMALQRKLVYDRTISRAGEVRVAKRMRM